MLLPHVYIYIFYNTRRYYSIIEVYKQSQEILYPHTAHTIFKGPPVLYCAPLPLLFSWVRNIVVSSPRSGVFCIFTISKPTNRKKRPNTHTHTHTSGKSNIFHLFPRKSKLRWNMICVDAISLLVAKKMCLKWKVKIVNVWTKIKIPR